MKDIPELVDGYRRFLSGRYPEESGLYRALAERGQSPGTMVIACCDSRADPATIFGAGPGELFVLRNVANLVHPYGASYEDEGLAAALEFAVTSLGVRNVVVMGHARCGGIQACLHGHVDKAPSSFVAKWVKTLEPTRRAILEDGSIGSDDERQRAFEHRAIRQSLENLAGFPFIREAMREKGLKLRGAYFGIADGVLMALDPETGAFEPIE